MFKSSIRNMIQIGESFHIFLSVLFSRFLDGIEEEAQSITQKVTNIHKFKHLCGQQGLSSDLADLSLLGEHVISEPRHEKKNLFPGFLTRSDTGCIAIQDGQRLDISD